jgi:hypothetical protein
MPRAPKPADPSALSARPKRSRRVAPPPPSVTALEIERLAYELYEARGRTDGAQLDDWLQAERQLLTRTEA